MKAVVVIPIYNEKENLEELVDSIKKQKVDLDILFVDDNSPDGSGILAEKLSQENPQIFVLHRQTKKGLGPAYIDGFKWALNNEYEIIMQMDADLSHDPNSIPEFLEKIKTNDAVFGSRYLNGVRVYNWPFINLLISKLSNEFIRFMLRMDTTDTTTAYKSFRKKVLESIDLDSLKGKQNAFLIELVYKVVKSGFKIQEIPFMFMGREAGQSKAELKSYWESLIMVFKLMITKTRVQNKKTS